MTQPQPFQPVPPQGAPGTVKPHRGVLILVLGILGLVVCMPVGIVAWVMANTDLREIRAGLMDRTGESMTTIGRVLGIIAVVLWCVAVVCWILIAVVFVGAAARHVVN